MANRLPYERKGLSQHRETGIIELMLSSMLDPQKTFVEIGFGDGTENMTLDLLQQGYRGIGIDGRNWAPDVKHRYPDQLIKVECIVTPVSVGEHISADFLAPDFFSLDIDSFDFEVAKVLLDAGFAPAVVCCEINKKFGNDYASFPFVPEPPGRIYGRKYFYGCSLSKYQALWSQHGYEFFTTDRTATNAFWFDPTKVDIDRSLPTLNRVAGYDPAIIRKLIEADSFWHHNMDVIYQR